jgi:hypothetical protein
VGGLKVIVLEVGRPIVEDVEAQLGRPDRVISYKRPILEDEIPRIAGEVYNAVRELARGGESVALVLSGPLPLAFQIGQLVGLSHFKIQVYHYTAGRYKPVPPVTRDVMFGNGESNV